MYDSPAIDHALQALPEDTAAATRAVLHDVFGYSAFRGPQAEIVTHVADGGDCLVLMPTDRKSTRLNSSHIQKSRMPSSA